MAAEVKSFRRRQQAEARRSKNEKAVQIIARRRVNSDPTADPKSRGEDFEKHSKEEGDRAEDKNDNIKRGPVTCSQTWRGQSGLRKRTGRKLTRPTGRKGGSLASRAATHTFSAGGEGSARDSRRCRNT